jgi:hypothetical protein
VTPEPAEGAMALAALRAQRVLPQPDDPARLRLLRSAAARAGRVLVSASSAGGRGLLLGWLEGSEPAEVADGQVERRRPAPMVLLTFAASLRACWPDPDADPYPGVSTSEPALLSTLAAFGRPGALPLDDDGTGGGAERHHKGALRLLRAAGLLDPDDSCVRLGPAVALWSASDVAVLRRFHDRFPAPASTGEPA